MVMAAGDELTLQFDAATLPPPAQGWRRDFVLELSGWAKAGETNTLGADRVGPLPFRAMKEYPYRQPARAAWSHRWLTRQAMPHLPSLAPSY